MTIRLGKVKVIRGLNKSSFRVGNASLGGFKRMGRVMVGDNAYRQLFKRSFVIKGKEK